MAIPWLSRLMTGTVAPVRLLVPALVLGWITLMTAGPITPLDLALAAACSALAVVGGRWPFWSAIGQSVLLATTHLLSGWGGTIAKDAVAIAAGPELVSGSTAQPLQVVAGLALVELAARRSMRQAAAAGALLGVVEAFVPSARGADLLTTVYEIGFTVVVPVLLGAYLQATMRSYRQAQQAAQMAEQRRRDAERGARRDERTEIAREIHDMVAHHVASIALRTAVAREVLPRADQAVHSVLDDVYETATVALAELRRLVTVLRDPQAVSTLRPAQFGPGLLEPAELPESLAALVDRARTAGLDVDAALGPGLGRLEAVQALAVLRTAQEGLTNVTKHAGSGARAQLRIVVDPFGTTVEVIDEGPRTTRSARPFHGSGGHGLIGLTERIALFGGTVDAGPHRSGWRLTARIPHHGRDGDQETDGSRVAGVAGSGGAA